MHDPEKSETTNVPDYEKALYKQVAADHAATAGESAQNWAEVGATHTADQLAQDAVASEPALLQREQDKRKQAYSDYMKERSAARTAEQEAQMAREMAPGAITEFPPPL